MLQEEAVKATKHKEEKMKIPKPGEQEGMPQHQHCPPVQQSAAEIRTQSTMKSSRKKERKSLSET
jgi:hypothetical protein